MLIRLYYSELHDDMAGAGDGRESGRDALQVWDVGEASRD